MSNPNAKIMSVLLERGARNFRNTGKIYPEKGSAATRLFENPSTKNTPLLNKDGGRAAAEKLAETIKTTPPRI